MKPSSWDKQLGLASPLESAASQSGQTNNPSRNETGLDASHHTRIFPRGGENLSFLTSSFRDRGMLPTCLLEPVLRSRHVCELAESGGFLGGSGNLGKDPRGSQT